MKTILILILRITVLLSLLIFGLYITKSATMQEKVILLFFSALFIWWLIFLKIS